MFGKKNSDYEFIGMIDKRWHMLRIRCDLLKRTGELLGDGDGPYFLSGPSGSSARFLHAGEEVVVMAIGPSEIAKENLEIYEKVRIVGVTERDKHFKQDMIVEKENGVRVILKMPFVVISISDYRRYFVEVDGWEHWNSETMRPDGRCPVY